MNTIYLDNAATSFPKPEGVSDAMKHYMDQVGGLEAVLFCPLGKALQKLL